MRAGDLRHRVTIQQLVTVYDEYNQPVEMWQDLTTVWAAIEPLSGREYWQAKAVNAEVTHRVRMRYRAGITPEMRLVFNGRVFEILAVLNLEERNIELQLLCKEAV